MAGHLVVCPCGYIHLYFNLYAIATSLEWLLSERWPLWKGLSVFSEGGEGGKGNSTGTILNLTCY